MTEVLPEACRGCDDFCPESGCAGTKAMWLKSRAKYYTVPKGSYLFHEIGRASCRERV